MHGLIDNNAHKIPAVVPDYLTPSFLKKEKKALKGRIKLLVNPYNSHTEDFKTKLRKRMMKDRGADFDEVEFENKLKKMKSKRGEYVTVNLNKEDPEVIDPSMLKSTNARKLWKQKHNIKKRFAKSKIRKGIYE